MKKLILNLLLGISLCANAQLTVIENGQTMIGKPISSLTDIDETASLNLWDISYKNYNPNLIRDMGSITFGNGSNAKIGGNSSAGEINIIAKSRFTIRTSKTSNPIFLWNALNNGFSFSQNVSAPSFLTSSDARLKTNVATLGDMFNGLQDVKAFSYNLTSNSSDTKASSMAVLETDNEETFVKDDRTHFGFIAQEIQKIYPNLVVEDEDGLLAIDYTGFIPLLVEAYKDLSNKVKEQEDIISTLTRQRGPSLMPASVNGVAEHNAVLKQNKPNPFNSSTSIECTLPENIASAFLCVYDLQGKQVYRIDIRERGDVVNVIDASYFTPGMYIYSLITDGVEVDSKRMIITD